MIMNILVALNENYIPPLKVMLRSLFDNCGEKLAVYMLHTEIGEEKQQELSEFAMRHGHMLYPLAVELDTFAEAPVNSYYSKEMYYRLLAHTILPEGVDRALYLDPDILVLNPIDDLYNTELDDHFFAAAAHAKPMIGYINKIRLGTEANSYYNSGVLLINVERLRREMDVSLLFDYVKKNAAKLILPDQDLLNGLYWEKIKPLDECLYNYDARRYRSYLIGSMGQVNIDYIVHNTVILHFCGKQKPWKSNYPYRFGILYKHYQKLTEKEEQKLCREPV